MTTHEEMRLLPWSGPDGKPCYLSSDNSNSYLSRLADNTESVQLGMAAELLNHAQAVLACEKTGEDDLRILVAALTGALFDVRRVAWSRGNRITSRESS